MVVTAKYEIELSEWEIVTEGTELEVVIFDEYSGFVGILYNGKRYYVHPEYLSEIPSLVTN